LDAAVDDVFHNTPCPCTPQYCSQHDVGYRIGIAVVKKMEIDEVHGLSEDASGSALLSPLI